MDVLRSWKTSRNIKHHTSLTRYLNEMSLFQIFFSYVELGEVGEDLREAVMVVLLGELHLSHVKVSDTVNLVMFVYHRGRLPLGFG